MAGYNRGLENLARAAAVALSQNYQQTNALNMLARKQAFEANLAKLKRDQAERHHKENLQMKLKGIQSDEDIARWNRQASDLRTKYTADKSYEARKYAVDKSYTGMPTDRWLLDYTSRIYGNAVNALGSEEFSYLPPAVQRQIYDNVYSTGPFIQELLKKYHSKDFRDKQKEEKLELIKRKRGMMNKVFGSEIPKPKGREKLDW